MNEAQNDILIYIFENGYTSQRDIAKNLNLSLGLINKTLNKLVNNNLLNEQYNLTIKAINKIQNNSPQNAIILAAGYGMRMVPINQETPKGLIKFKNEPLIERIIKQLYEANIKKIYIVVGFLKEKFEYLIDKYNVHLIVNNKYGCMNNLYSLYLAKDFIHNSYIIPSDVWCQYSPFRKNEINSWYLVTNENDFSSNIKLNRKNELLLVNNNGNKMIGISYINKSDSLLLKKQLNFMVKNPLYFDSFWEQALIKKKKFSIPGRIIYKNEIVEINTYEQLRDLDENSSCLNNIAINIIEDVFKVDKNKIENIEILKKGMTNRSFLFTINNQKYIMRIPGEGTDKLIKRDEEACVYNIINGKNISDDLIYINPQNGYKITKFFLNARVCDATNNNDLKAVMKKLKEFHQLKLKVQHEFNIYEKINFYESLWTEKKSIYEDYQNTKKNVLSLQTFIEENIEEKILTHIDAIPDNFLFTDEGVRLIDWEYSGMQDPHVDIAMFIIYSLYNKEQADNLIDIYFDNKCKIKTRIKIYCYIALCGLLWSNWCEYKRNLGIDFGEYSLAQYRFAKDFYNIAKQEMEKLK